MKKFFIYLSCFLLFFFIEATSPATVSAVDCSQNCGSGNGFCGCTEPPVVTCSDNACTQNCIVVCPTPNNCTLLGGDEYCSNFGASCPASTDDRQFFDEKVTCNTSTGNCESTCPYFSCSVDSASATGSTTGTATTKSSGTALDGYDRIDWYANSVWSGANTPSNGNGSVSLQNLSPNTTYAVTAVYWTSNNQPVSRPSVTCSGSPSFLTYPAAPNSSTFSASCPAPGTSATISFGSSPGGAAQYNLRVNDNNDSDGSSFNPINYPTNPAGDFAINNASQSLNYPNFIAGHNYDWWVDACNSSGCSVSQAGPNFTCTAPAAAILANNCTGTPNPEQVNQNITWNISNVSGGSGTYTYSWSGTDGLSGTTSSTTATSNSISKIYTTAGTKNATVQISSGTSTPITKTCSVLITAPDLQVEPLSPVTVEAGNPVSVSATVKNYGDGTTGVSSITRLKIDTKGTNDDKSTAILAAGGTASHTWSSVWTPATAGTYNYQVCADATNTVAEGTTNEGNNCKVSSITVNAPPAPGAPSTPTVTAPACSTAAYTATVSWTGTPLPATDTTGCPNGYWVDVDTDTNWGNGYFHKCTTSTSTIAPTGFGAFAGATGTLTLLPDQTYYARVYNGNISGVRSFNSPSCILAFNYSLTNSGDITLNQGSSGANTITRTLISGTSAGVTLSASGLPSGATASFTNNPCTPTPTCSSTLTISTLSTTPTGQPTITVTGSPLGKTTTFTLTVNAAGSPPCGNNICEAGETTLTCPADCPPGGPGSGIRPWIQTTGGDVHSNTGITP